MGEKLQSLHHSRGGYPWARERLLALKVNGSENQLGAQWSDLKESPVVSHFLSCLGQGAKAQAAHSRSPQPLHVMVFTPCRNRSTMTSKHLVIQHSQFGHPEEAWGHHCSLPATSATSGELQELLWLREQVCLGLALRKMQIYCNSRRKITCWKWQEKENHQSSKTKMFFRTEFGPLRHIICHCYSSKNIWQWRIYWFTNCR